MADPDELALSYLLPPSLSFWHWQDRGDAVAWIDGGTIAFREALIVVLERLSPRGLPPLGCVLLLLAACRDSWREGRRETGRIDGIPLPLTVPRQQERERTQIAGVVAALDRIHAFDRKYRTNIEMAAVMAELVFENAAVRTTTETSQAVIAALRAGIIADVSDHHAMRAEPQPSFDSEMKILLDGLPLVTEDAIESRRRRGVEQDLAPVPLDLPPAERVRRLIDDLQTDVELSGVARLARKLLAALSVLRPVSAPDELALGGVSDITNRGPLDRLLLSELAHDDLTLATRIAMGEALYLRREAPPCDPPAVRSILIDAGLRLWGIPRLFAAAVGVAFSAVDRTVDVSAFHASCNKIVPVDLSTRTGLQSHLESLEPELHPGAALAPFRAHLDETDETLEPILITHADVLDDADFRQSLAATRFAVLWIASLDRTGSFSLHSFTPSGRKLLREARFSLDDILEPPKQSAAPVAPVVDVEVDNSLPLIFSVKPFPLLLPIQLKPGRAWSTYDGGGIGITTDRRLMSWEDSKFGARQLSQYVPASRVHFVGWLECENYVLILGPHNSGTFYIGWTQGNGSRLKLRDLSVKLHEVLQVVEFQGVIQIVQNTQVTMVDKRTGDLVATLPIEYGMKWRGGRFYHQPFKQAFFAAVLAKGKAEWMAVTGKIAFSPKNSRVFEVAGADSFLFFARRTDIFSLSSGRECNPDESLMRSHIANYSKRGSGHVLIRGYEPRTKDYIQILYDLFDDCEINRWPPVSFGSNESELDRSLDDRHGHPFWLVEGIPRPSIVRPGPSNRFERIAVERFRETLLLKRSRHDRWLELSWKDSSNSIRLVECLAQPTNEVNFSETVQPQPRGIRYRTAHWSSSDCRAVLDSRGLLHLTSHSNDIPQIALVLSQGIVSGWCSDGRMFGEPFFIGGHAATSPKEVFDKVILPFVRRVAGC